MQSGSFLYYVLDVKRDKVKGKVHIMEVDQHYLIRGFQITNDEYWSTAWHLRLPARVSVKLQYKDNISIVESIEAIQRKDGLEYRNEFLEYDVDLEKEVAEFTDRWFLNNEGDENAIGLVNELQMKYF